MPKKGTIDYKLLAIILGLLTVGLIALYSASTVESFENFGNTTHYIFHQIKYGLIIGVVAMIVFSKIDYHKWQKFLPLIVLGSLILLTLVKMPGVGFSFGGASRWIHFGPIFFQPSEIAKLAVIFYLAAWSEKKQKHDNFIFGILPSLLIVGLFAFLILWQPDFGTMSILIGISAVMLYSSGMKLKYFFWLAVLGLLALVTLIKLEPYRYQRVISFLNPEFDPQGSSYQINQALLAIGAGGVWGYGYGLSRQKHNYLPEPMGDSLFAVAAEELGFVRILFIIFLFGVFTLKGFSVAKNAPDNFGKMVALGITTWIALQVIVNIASMLGLMPLTGVPLPFFSYGSSSLFVILAAMGILLNISKQAK